MGFVKEIPELFAHQGITVDYLMENDNAYDASDPGTGKTRSALEMILRRQKAGAKKAIVFAPKSILVPSWANDLRAFTPTLRYVVATATNRKKAFAQDVDVYITNIDAAKWVLANVDLTKFDIIILDECTAYKHRTSARSKAMAGITKQIQYKVGMSGTPNPNGVLDLWHQYFLLDGGAHLGTNFWKFRMTVCEPTQTGPGPEMIKWTDKPGVASAVADLLADMTIRHKMEECISIPPHSVHKIYFDLDKKHAKAYKDLADHAIIELSKQTVTAIHKGALRTKLLQLASGAVYDVEGASAIASTARYELVLDLAEERESCVIAFTWRHQRDEILRLAKKRGIDFALIDGSVKDADRTKAVKDFQSGKIKILFAHPMSASHGLTLTKGTTTIWSGPIDDAERFQQFNRRIYRAGQDRKTETLMVCANDTIEDGVYNNLDCKVSDMVDLLDILEY